MSDPEKKQEKPIDEAPEESADIEIADNGAEGVPPVEEGAPAETDTETAEGTPEPEAEIEPPAESDASETDEPTAFDDEQTDRVVDEIASKESDEAMAAEDATTTGEEALPMSPKRHFWRKKWLRTLLVLLVLGGLVALGVVPKTRYVIMNTATVRSSFSVTVVDSTTQLPLKGVHVTVAGHTTQTDADGKAKLTGLKLGKASLEIEQVGFGQIKRTITIGWGSNPLGTLALQATGVQYVIEVHDYLSEQPIEGVEASDGQSSALSGKDGKITLVLSNTAVAKNAISLTKAGYRTETIGLGDDPNVPTKAMMVLARKAVFAVRQNGGYTVYKSDIDGRNRDVLLTGTGAETNNVSLVVSPDGTRAAWVSTRDNKRDSSGTLLSSLVLLNVDTGDQLTIAQSSQIQLIDWAGSRLVFQSVSPASDSGSRYTITSYNYADNSRLQLAAANSFSAVTSARGQIYYAVSLDTSNPSQQLGLFKIAADGNGKQRVFDTELSTVLRPSYNILNLQTADGSWYVYDLTTSSKTKVDTPGSLANRQFIDNNDRSASLWVNQGALTNHDIAGGKDTVVKTQAGIAYPFQWLSNSSAIYRLSIGGETADYAISTVGGTAHKVADVAPTYGFAQAQ